MSTYLRVGGAVILAITAAVIGIWVFNTPPPAAHAPASATPDSGTKTPSLGSTTASVPAHFEILEEPTPPPPEQIGSPSISGVVYSIHLVWYPHKLADLYEQYTTQGPQALEAACELQKTPYPRITVMLSTGIQTVTDKVGQYTFRGLSQGTYTVSAVVPPDAAQFAPEFDPAIARNVEVASESVEHVDLLIDTDSVTVTGRVRDDLGNPIPGALVEAEPIISPDGEDEAHPQPIHGTTLRTKAGTQGTYTIQGLLPAHPIEVGAYLYTGTHLPSCGRTYIVRAYAPGFAPAQVIVPAIPYSIIESALALYEAAARIEGSDRAVRKPGLVLPAAPGDVIEGIDIVLESEPSHVSGRVVNTAGKPLPNVAIAMGPSDAERPRAFAHGLAPPRPTATDDAGAFNFVDCPAGLFAFEVDTGSGFQLARSDPITVAANSIYTGLVVVAITASDRGRIEGRIIPPRGDPLPEPGRWDPELSIVRVDSPGEDPPSRGALTIDPETGSYRVEGISSGIARLEGTPPGYAPVRAEIEVSSGITTQFDIHLIREGILHGYVTVNGVPPPECFVDLLMLSGTSGSAELHDDSSVGIADERGHYEIDRLGPGIYLATYMMFLSEGDRQGPQIYEEARVQIEAGRETRADIAYDGTGTIHGNVTAPEGVAWRVVILDNQMESDDKLRAYADADREYSRYRLTGLAAGTYTVVGEYQIGDEPFVRKSAVVKLEEGRVVQLDFTLP